MILDWIWINDNLPGCITLDSFFALSLFIRRELLVSLNDYIKKKNNEQQRAIDEAKGMS